MHNVSDVVVHVPCFVYYNPLYYIHFKYRPAHNFLLSFAYFNRLIIAYHSRDTMLNNLSRDGYLYKVYIYFIYASNIQNSVSFSISQFLLFPTNFKVKVMRDKTCIELKKIYNLKAK